MNYLIEEQSQLTDLKPLFTQLHEQSSHVAVDTEFLREKTYNAKLCLVQLGIGEHQYCIDVLAIEDLSLLADLFSDQKILKLFHAARQDMEVLYQTLGVMPKPIFDTQLAAAFNGLDMQIGYSALVQHRLDIELPKSQARTDWTRRPLSSVQLAYAADDVAHLTALYEISNGELEDQGKLAWYAHEIEDYYEVDRYMIDPAMAYKRLAGGGLKVAQQYVLKALAEWRESMAQLRDIPRTWVLRDDKLFDLAAQRPTDVAEILRMGVFGNKSSHRMAPIAAKLISEVEVGEQRLWDMVEPLDKRDKAICSGMMKELAKLAQEHEVAQGLLATRRDVESLFRQGQSEKLLNGWREDLVGLPLLRFIESKAKE
jgi:ribonuclease D